MPLNIVGDPPPVSVMRHGPQRLPDLLGAGNRRHCAEARGRDRRGHGGIAARGGEIVAGNEPRDERAAERVAGAGRVDRRHG